LQIKKENKMKHLNIIANKFGYQIVKYNSDYILKEVGQGYGGTRMQTLDTVAKTLAYRIKNNIYPK
tara:strand:- start:286 stop:483 length:198 start_codon:yes stop_codon:yes gene_type:complete